LLQPIFATVDAVADFAEQFTRLESENIQLRKAVKASADQVLEANKLAAEVQGENTCLKEELEKLKKKMKDDQEAQHKAFMEADEKEGALRESIENLLSKFLQSCMIFF
jgi:predicted  nucleic acid-binding Zn-ribbon protein